MSNTKRIFISHSSKDNAISSVIASELRHYGYTVWYDESDLGLGRFIEEIEVSLSNSQIFMVLLSEDARASLWVNRELGAAFDMERETGMLIVPALVRPCVIPPFLRSYRYLDFTGERDYDAEFKLLIRMLNQDEMLPAFHPSQRASMKTHIPAQQPSINNTISGVTFSGNGTTINQGQNIYNVHTTYSTPSQKAERNDFYLKQFTALVDDMKRDIENGIDITTDRQEEFLSMMSTISTWGDVLSATTIKRVRFLCQHLALMALL